MSYDVSIGSESFNYTYNVSRLFYDHIPAERGDGGLRELDGLTGRRAAEVLASAFDRMQSTRHKLYVDGVPGEPQFSAKYDAPNGWGSALGAILFLAQIMAACHANGRKKVSVS